MFRDNCVFVRVCSRQTDPQRLHTEAMAMGKLHKDVGHLIVQSAEDAERSDGQVIKVRTHSAVFVPNLQLRFQRCLTRRPHIHS